MRFHGLRMILGGAVLVATTACGDNPAGPSATLGMYDANFGQAWIPPGDAGGCDPWLDLGWCREPVCTYDNEAGPIEEALAHDCGPGGGDPPGAGGPIPDEPEPDDETPEPCDTGDSVLDSRGVQSGFRDPWRRKFVENFLSAPADELARVRSGTSQVDVRNLRLLTEPADAAACRALTHTLTNGTRSEPAQGRWVFFAADGFFFAAEWREAQPLSSYSTRAGVVLVFDSQFRIVGAWTA